MTYYGRFASRSSCLLSSSVRIYSLNDPLFILLILPKWKCLYTMTLPLIILGVNSRTFSSVIELLVNNFSRYPVCITQPLFSLYFFWFYSEDERFRRSIFLLVCLCILCRVTNTTLEPSPLCLTQTPPWVFVSTPLGSRPRSPVHPSTVRPFVHSTPS